MYNQKIDNLQDKIKVLEDRYQGEKQKIYFQEIIMAHPQIKVLDFKKGQTKINNSMRCSFCSQKFLKYYSILKEVKTQGFCSQTILCTSCAYRCLSVNSQKLKIQYSQASIPSIIKNPIQQLQPQILKSIEQAPRNIQDDDSWANQLDGYSLNFQQQEFQDEMISLVTEKKTINFEKNNSNQDKEETISSKQQSSHRYSQEQKVKLQQGYQSTQPNTILLLLQKINQKAIQFNPIAISIKLIVFENIYKEQKKSGLHQSNYLNYFQRNILRQIMFKTYNQKDRIKKNQIQFIYQYWIKALRKHLQTNYQTKIREYLKRNSELSKKITMRDRKIAELNKDSKMSQEFIGFKKNGPKWNEIIRQLRLKLFDFQNLKDIKTARNLI